MSPSSQQTHAGFVALIGAPNAGKSTLLNQLLGQKLSIVSPKAQTTRMRVLGLLCEGDTQIGLIDTPGLFNGKTGSSKKLEKTMQDSIASSLEDADLVLFLVDASGRDDDERVQAILDRLQTKRCPVCLVLNKTDKIHREKLLPLAQKFGDLGLFDEIFMISALSGDGLAPLRAKIFGAMPQGPWLFPEDEISDMPARLLAAETTREQLFLKLHDELPYEATVLPDKWENKNDGSAVIHQTILVTRPAHRAIVLGKGGQMIKSIGLAARLEIARLLDRRVHLFLDVRVDEKWQDKGEFYRLFGLED